MKDFDLEIENIISEYENTIEKKFRDLVDEWNQKLVLQSRNPDDL